METVAEVQYLPFFLQVGDKGKIAPPNGLNKMVTPIQSSLFRRSIKGFVALARENKVTAWTWRG